jgi:transcriptional regulator with XRE-family HTH domain
MVNDLMGAVAANLRRLRTEQGRSLSELARSGGIAKATLSALETGKGNPTIETLSALAAALGVPFGDLLAGGQPEPVHVVHAAEGTIVPGTANDLRLIVRLPGNPPTELYEARFPARSRRSAGAHGPGTREHVYVTQGSLRTGPLDRPADLRAGDYAGFAGDEMHLYEAGPRGARALLIMQWASQP